MSSALLQAHLVQVGPLVQLEGDPKWGPSGQLGCTIPTQEHLVQSGILEGFQHHHSPPPRHYQQPLMASHRTAAS